MSYLYSMRLSMKNKQTHVQFPVYPTRLLDVKNHRAETPLTVVTCTISGKVPFSMVTATLHCLVLQGCARPPFCTAYTHFMWKLKGLIMWPYHCKEVLKINTCLTKHSFNGNTMQYLRVWTYTFEAFGN